MEEFFDGRKIRDEILKDLSNKVVKMKRKPTMAVFLIGDNPVCRQYVELKQKLAVNTGVQFCLYQFGEEAKEDEIISAIEYLNNDPETDGIMIQIPVAGKFDRNKFIEKISPEKDIDGLRYCAGLDSKFKPPVVLSILEAIKRSDINLEEKKVVVVGKGFLVGAPLIQALKEKSTKFDVISNDSEKSHEISRLDKSMARNDRLLSADIVISATGKPGIIKENMVKEGVVLIDAGTAEENGQLVGDIDPEAYKKARYYTPVPGGIGPVTVAMLFQNLIEK